VRSMSAGFRWLLLAVAVCAGCTLKQYAGQADRAAYRTLAASQKAALGRTKPFDVNYRPFRPAPGGDDGQIRVGKKVIPIGGGKPVVLTLDDCLEIALRNSRSYQTRKEGLYSEALDLANTMRGWSVPLFGGELDSEASITRVHKTSETKEASAEIGPSITQRFVHGGVLTLAATLDWATDFIFGSESNVVGSLVEANFTQPVLRGAWRGLAYEDQYRLARDFLFAVFDYERFRQTFAADIFRRYYSVLQSRDQLENDRSSIERQKRTLELTRVQVTGGQASRIDQDRSEQALLQAQLRFEQRQQSYLDSLDSFKITLGLPVESNISLDYPGALKALAEAGPKPIGLDEAQAIAVAMSVRPDVLTERAKLRDADRDVEIAADQFLPQLDVELGIYAEGTEPRRFERIRFHEHTRFAKVTFNYELDQTDNRDNYRLAVIAYEKAKRDLAEFLDEVRLAVRRSYRELMQSKRSYELQVRNVRIARRRHKLATLRQKEGLLSPTDVLDAEQDLREAQNGLTNSLVSYTTTRLQFMADLGMIDVDERGKLHERAEPFKFDRIARRHERVSGE